MGTRAKTAIHHQEDRITVYTNHDGYHDVIKNDIKNLTDDYHQSVELLRTLISSDNHVLSPWLQNLELLLQSHATQPTVNTTSALLCMKELQSHNPCDRDSNPDLCAHFTPKKVWQFRQLAAPKKATMVDPDYYVVRLLNGDPEELVDGNLSFVDCKIHRSVDIHTLNDAVVQLPLFWRTFLQTVNLPYYSFATDIQRKAIRYPLFKIQQTLKQLYYPHSYFQSLFTFNRDKPSTFEEQHHQLQQIAHSMIPLSLHAGSFLSHLMIRFPGFVYPLSTKEKLSQPAITHSFFIDTERLNNIWIPLQTTDEWAAMQQSNLSLNQLIEQEEEYYHEHGLSHLASPALEYAMVNNTHYMKIPYVNNCIESLLAYQEYETSHYEQHYALPTP